jgi:hypothetical protein
MAECAWSVARRRTRKGWAERAGPAGSCMAEAGAVRKAAAAAEALATYLRVVPRQSRRPSMIRRKHQVQIGSGSRQKLALLAPYQATGTTHKPLKSGILILSVRLMVRTGTMRSRISTRNGDGCPMAASSQSSQGSCRTEGACQAQLVLHCAVMAHLWAATNTRHVVLSPRLRQCSSREGTQL